ncbi:hypothetical protein HK100_006082 [Physocladia obscura]|uniref:MHD domain-containing protein n=1 Tax=Physocladia obscura TaxID=109957 RepID=A0AAD5SSC8_9FUNG|nr:hypothetical protein HK100_006082 [Physocladia obscura]
MLSAFFVFNAKGEVLISRLYRNDIKRSVSDIFRIQVVSSTDVRSPITTVGSTAFFHHKHENIYLVAVSKLNVNAAIVFEFLYKVSTIGQSYFGKFDENAVKANFTLIYELLDEICDFGFPQITEPEALKLYITTEGVKSEKAILESGKQIAIQATGAVSWRRPDIKYRKNEAFLDVVESVNLLMSSKGTVLRADVSGQVMMRVYLSGMPECKFGLNDRISIEGGEHAGRIVPPTVSSRKNGGGHHTTVDLDDTQFHQCVKLSNFEETRTITFIPPDGEFELMRYRSTNTVHLPFRVNAIVDEFADENHVNYKISVRALYDAKVFGQNIVIKIPTPPSTNDTKIKVTGGKAKYVGSENAIIWKIARFQGGQEFVITAQALTTTTNSKRAWSRPPISMDFQVVMFTASGLVVRFLKIYEKSNYQSIKWVRYLTKAGSYQISSSFPYKNSLRPLPTPSQSSERCASEPLSSSLFAGPSVSYTHFEDRAVVDSDNNSSNSDCQNSDKVFDGSEFTSSNSGLDCAISFALTDVGITIHESLKSESFSSNDDVNSYQKENQLQHDNYYPAQSQCSESVLSESSCYGFDDLIPLKPQENDAIYEIYTNGSIKSHINCENKAAIMSESQTSEYDYNLSSEIACETPQYFSDGEYSTHDYTEKYFHLSKLKRKRGKSERICSVVSESPGQQNNNNDEYEYGGLNNTQSIDFGHKNTVLESDPQQQDSQVYETTSSNLERISFLESEHIRFSTESVELKGILVQLRKENAELKACLVFSSYSHDNENIHPMMFVKEQTTSIINELAVAVATIKGGMEKGFQEVVDGMQALKHVTEQLNGLGGMVNL